MLALSGPPTLASVRIDHERRRRSPITDDESAQPSIRERARYRLDNLLARGTVATLVSLGTEFENIEGGEEMFQGQRPEWRLR